MKRYTLHIVAILQIVIQCSSGQTNSWTPKSFLNDLANDPDVTQMVRTVAQHNYYSALDEIKILGKTPNKKTRAALLRIAYGEIGQQYVKRAAGVYVASLEDKMQARALLVSLDADAQEYAFRELRGYPLDEELFVRSGACLTNDSVLLRESIVRLYQADTNVELAERKTSLIVNSMKTMLACKEAKNPINLTMEAIFEKDTVPIGESGLGQHATELGQTKGVTSLMIRNALGLEKGIVCDFAIIAMAYTGDPDARPELHHVLTNSTCMTARFYALGILSWKPKPGDVPALEWVAANDPFKSRPSVFYFRLPDADKSLENKRESVIYPLRIYAEQSLQRLHLLQNQEKE